MNSLSTLAAIYPSITKANFPHSQDAEGFSAMNIALVITLIITVVAITLFLIIISRQKDKNLAEERAKQNKEFIEKLWTKRNYLNEI